MMVDFAIPQFLLMALLLPFVVALKIWSAQRGARSLNTVVAKRLQKELVRRVPAAADWFLFSMQLLGVLCLIAAAARPQWGFREIETVLEGRNVFVAIDTSRSMLANDVEPNRLERAKRAAQDLVRNLSSDRVGLIAFAGRPFVLAPLTVDHEAVLEAIDQLDTQTIGRGGTNLAKPALMALDTMAQAETSLAALVIFSDGEDLESNQELGEFQRRAGNSGLLVVSVGVGTDAGAIVPDLEAGPGNFIRDDAGQVVRSRLNLDVLRKLSDWTGGICVNLGEHASVSVVVQETLQRLEAQRLQARETRVPVERYAIPLVCGLLLLVLSHISPMVWFARSPRSRIRANGSVALGLLTAGLLSPAEPSSASDEGWALYQRGHYPEAQSKYMDQSARSKSERERRIFSLGLGAAAFRCGDFEGAKLAFAEALLSKDSAIQEQAHYNLGNTLFEEGRKLFPEKIEGTIAQLEGAVLHYEAALRLNSGDRQATRNAAFVRDLIDKLRKLPPPQQKNQPQPNPDQNPPPPGPQPPEPPNPDTAPPPPKSPSPPPQSPPNSEPPPPENWPSGEARRILENNADEDKKVKSPQVMKFEPGGFRNW